MIPLPVPTFLAADPQPLINQLAHDDFQRFQRNHAQQLRAWDITLLTLHRALEAWPEAAEFHLVLEFAILRLGRRIDAVLITPRAIIVLEFKAGATAFDTTSQRQAEDYAIDLQDFHESSRNRPIIPILVATSAADPPTNLPLMLEGAWHPLLASARSLGPLLKDLHARLPSPTSPINPATWHDAPYRPVPNIIDAACTLYTRNAVADIQSAGAPAHNLRETTTAILAAIAEAKTRSQHLAIFVTGTPGAGKTLCGLNAVFGAGRESGATFLTGNPTLVHVLREALARDAAGDQPKLLRAARQRTEAAIQVLPKFRDHHVLTGHTPAEHVAVIDEAQRVWSAPHAIRKTLARPVRLSDSEPAHILDAMARHPDWAVIVCLVGNGQEIHDGEGGLAEWSTALAARPIWQTRAAPQALQAAEPRQRLAPLPNLHLNPALHLDIPVRNIRSPVAGPWADALLRNNPQEAASLAADPTFPFRLTRDAHAMRAHLRATARGHRRAGLLASSGAKRLRADGFGAELPHMDASAVARWFLDRWPEDVRASDALETLATEFSFQGLELDHVGLAWGGDLIRTPNSWRIRDFVGTKWQTTRAPEAIANRLNTYRVLLTRARYETILWVPAGDAADQTRQPHEFDAIAAFLQSCGVPPLAPTPVVSEASKRLLF
jgi:hypothetical protein